MTCSLWPQCTYVSTNLKTKSARFPPLPITALMLENALFPLYEQAAVTGNVRKEMSGTMDGFDMQHSLVSQDGNITDENISQAASQGP